MANDPKRTTIAQIAQAAGVSKMTVSRALSNHKWVAEPTRKRIQKLAETMGYQPDPALSALSAYRQKKRAHIYHSTLALVIDEPRKGLRTRRNLRDQILLRGAQEHARKLGYEVEIFRVGTTKRQQKRLSDVLYARGIRGLLLATGECRQESLAFDWNRFVSVCVARNPGFPYFHAVSFNFYHAAMQLLKNIWQLGYRRPGFMYDEGAARATEYQEVAAYDHFSRKMGIDKVPFCNYTDAFNKRKQFFSWLGDHQVDVLIATEDTPLQLIRERGWTVPKDIGYASSRIPRTSNTISGVKRDVGHLGRVAVDILSSIIQRNEIGKPKLPYGIQIESEWVKGTTLIQQRT
ncbi:MAG: LacI family DNA-binding transcriptional regulator [Verrucomicrobiota bacterium]